MKTRDYGKVTGMACGGTVKHMADGGETTDMLDGSTQVNESSRTPDYEASKDLPVAKMPAAQKATLPTVTVAAKRDVTEDNAPTKANAEKLNKASAAQSAAYSSNEMDRLAKYTPKPSDAPKKTSSQLADDELKNSGLYRVIDFLNSPSKNPRGSSPGRYSQPKKMANGGSMGSFASGLADGYASGESAKLKKSMTDKFTDPKTATMPADDAPKKQSFKADDISSVPSLPELKANGGLIEGHKVRQDRYRK